MGAAVKGVLEIVAGVLIEIFVPYVGKYLGALVISYGLGQIITSLNGRPSNNVPAVPWQFMANGATYPRSIVYGTTRISGRTVYERLKP